jgi:hypothetical protein
MPSRTSEASPQTTRLRLARRHCLTQDHDFSALKTAGGRALAWAVLSAFALNVLAAQAPRTTPRFRPADPVAIDDDTIADASAFEELELSEGFDLLANQFGSPGDGAPKRAVNLNTVDEVPDSSWFTNRIGIRPMPLREIVRGANKFDPVEAREWDTWTVVEGKGPRSFQPGFRAERPGDPGQVYQLEVDPIGHPRLATGAEFIGGLIYHALGYFVEDVYVLKVHPRNLRISEKATIRDPSGRRRFTSHDLDNILRVAARDHDGRVYMSATRYDGKDLGNFEYHGTRSDDPNDIYPHEHRRELRANRVFAAWLAHDDSRALNTRNVRVVGDGRNYVRHYMRDFGALLGSSTRFTEPPISNHEYYVEKDSSLKRLSTLGFYTPNYVRTRAPQNIPASIGWFESSSFDPDAWRPNYPNAAFSNMQLDDAFWGARLVSKFSDDAIRAIVEQAGYDDPQAVEYLTRTLVRRRDIIARTWLNGVNPIVDVSLDTSGTLSFTNAAVAAGVATHGTYTIAWARFDNQSGSSERASVETHTQPRVAAPASLLSSADFIEATIWSEQADHPAWREPVRVYFRRDGAAWKTVGLTRTVTYGMTH